MLRKIIIVTVVFVILLGFCLISNSMNTVFNVKAEEKVVLYSANNMIIRVNHDEVGFYLKMGWYDIPVQTLWHKDGYSSIIAQSEIYDYLNTGEWFTCKPDIPEPQQITVDTNDQILLAKVIYAEATEQPALRYTDRCYVGAVVMNRLRMGYWGSTLKQVIYARGQYACVGTHKFNSNPPQECLDIAKALLLGERFGVPDNVIFQAQFRQGSGLWKKVGVHYYCYR